MANILTAIDILITVFKHHSGKEGDDTTLTKGELKALLQAEMGPLLDKAKDQGAVDKIFKNLDFNSDGVVDFTEYATLIACLASQCHESLQKIKS